MNLKNGNKNQLFILFIISFVKRYPDAKIVAGMSVLHSNFEILINKKRWEEENSHRSKS